MNLRQEILGGLVGALPEAIPFGTEAGSSGGRPDMSARYSRGGGGSGDGDVEGALFRNGEILSTIRDLLTEIAGNTKSATGDKPPALPGRPAVPGRF